MKLGKFGKTIVLVALFVVLLKGCDYLLDNLGLAEDPSPRGVVTVSNCESYIVKIPTGKNVSDYFTLLGTSGTVVMHNFGNMNQDKIMGTAYYNQVKEGGWVIQGNGLFMHIPDDISSDAARRACNTFLTNQDNYMSVEEYKEYMKSRK